MEFAFAIKVQSVRKTHSQEFKNIFNMVLGIKKLIR